MRSYTKEAFTQAWKNSYSVSQVANTLGLNKSGGSIKILSQTALQLGLTKNHFGRTSSPRYFTLEELLVADSPIRGNSELREKLVKAGLKSNSCENCGRSEWLGQPIPLALDHENGINTDNRLENLHVLCLNCHGLTPTWCGKNKIRRASNGNLPAYAPGTAPTPVCGCGRRMTANAEQCIYCSNKNLRGAALASTSKITWPDVDTISTNVNSMGYAAYGRLLGVSDNAIRKHLKTRVPVNTR